MRSDNRGRQGLIRGAFGVFLLMVGLNACTSLAGGAALLGAVGIAALTSRCYDYVDVTVFDADGRKTCDAKVTAKNGNSQFELPTCYNATLTDGTWTLRASRSGSRDAVTTVVVDHAHDCTRYVQTVELTLNPAGSPPSAPRPISPLPAAVSAPTVAQPPPSALPPAAPPPEAAPSPATPSSASPPSSATPPVGVFPDSSQTH
jgi:hypothetical protein